jgi:hypothetical protein
LGHKTIKREGGSGKKLLYHTILAVLTLLIYLTNKYVVFTLVLIFTNNSANIANTMTSLIVIHFVSSANIANIVTNMVTVLPVLQLLLK